MEPPHPTPPLLEAIAGRQASDALRGYYFQIWRSVETWLDLGNNELLALEIAEDFDRLGQDKATTYQVKDVAHNMTLRSPEIIEAIGNFWEHKRSNPGYQLQFRFITTASVAVEKGDPFGPGVRGLEAWTSAARSGNGIGLLRDFLLNKNLPDDLKQFLTNSDEENIRTELLQPLHWAWEQGDADFVEERVRQSLVVLGKDKALAKDARDVADALFRRAFATATARKKTDRVLHLADLLTIFDQRTTHLIGLPQAMAAFREFGFLEAPGSTDLLILPTGYKLVSGPPPPLAQVAPRPVLVGHLARLLTSSGRLILTGTTGMGKSTLAKLVVTDDWLWAGLRWEKAVNRRVLHEVAARVAAESHLKGIVFDDYTPEEVDEIPFGALLGGLQRRGIPYIVTTSKTLPSRIVTELDLPRQCFAPVPGLTHEETYGLLVTYSCPPPQAEALAPILVAQAAGHPQLIHARIRDLTSTGWQIAPQQQLSSRSPTLEEVLSEVRTSHLQPLPEPARTLAYRLGLMMMPFRRDHALAVGCITPPIEMPGESFELLNGPWIERLDDRYLGVSPLLAGAAGEVWPPDQVTALHRSIARLLLTTGPLTVREAPGSLHHAYQGQDSNLLAELAFSILRADATVQEVIFPGLQWLLLIGTDGPLPRFIATSDGLAVRELQYRVAAEPEQKLRIASRWNEESRSPTLAAERVDPGYRLRFTMTMLMDRTAQHPIALLLQWLGEADEAFAEFTRRHPGVEQRLPPGPGSTETVDAAVSLFSFVLYSCHGIDELHELQAGMSQLDESFRARLLKVFEVLPELAASFMDWCLLGQAKRLEPDWPRSLEILAGMVDTARLWQRKDLREAAVRAQSKILHEFQHDTGAALQLLRRERGGASSAVLEDEEADLLQDQRQHAAALSIWRAGLPRWAAEDHADAILLGQAEKKAAISAAHLGEWREAARFFLESSTRLRTFHHTSFEEPESEPQLLLIPIALLADHAYCLWRAGDRRGSVAAFDSSISELERLGAQVVDLDDYRILTKVIGNVLLWLYEPQPSKLAEPYPGIFSSPRVTREILSLPSTDLDNLWALLCRLEATTDGEARVLERMRNRLAASENRVVSVLFHDAEIGRTLRQALVERLIPVLAAYCRAAVNTGYLAPCLRVGMLFGLLSWTWQRAGVEPPWEEWRAALKAAADPKSTEPIDRWIDVAREVFGQGSAELRSAVRQPLGDEKPPFQVVRVATEPGYSPDDIFRAQANLVTLYSGMGRPFGDVVAKVVEERWRQILDTPAALLAPRLNGPAIRQACDADGESFSKSAAILLAAEPAVRVPIDNATRRALTKLRDGTQS